QCEPWRCPYYFSEKSIIINDVWKEYFVKHIHVLQSFTYWHLCRFVQKNNPNVIGISEKLFKPQARNLRKNIIAWREYLILNPKTKCIYTGNTVPESFSLDHFIPWSYVVHDQNWNIIPVSKEINSSKSDSLPDLTKYLDPFLNLQYDFVKTLSVNELFKPILEHYAIAFNNSIDGVKEMPFEVFKNQLSNIITPMTQIASNLGFRTWNYTL
ncbi:MAG TPA: HNH endonuclease domain-containing protein, partial [Flavisolibacter sp.]|nr:HNH endonuclease domain-containing protein [Flavisolibacter sp.]